MKFTHLLPVLGVAAMLGALSQSSNGWGPAYAGEAAPAHSAVTPPWLTGDMPEASAEEPGAPDTDPHADVCAGLGVVADDGSDPHAASCAAQADPHAGSDVTDDASDPHAGLYAAAGDPHAGMYEAGDDDPHAGLYAAEGADEAVYEPVPIDTASAPPPALPVERSQAPNAKNVAEVFAGRTALDQKTLRVRGVVVKLTEGILGKNFLHLQDGSGSAEAGDNDLTVTSTEAFQLGETVEVEGQLAIDQDVGVGYRYPALLAAATRVTH